jgi:hypothetical protein
MSKPDKPVTDEQIEAREMQVLLEQPQFLRFLWRVIQISGLWDRTTNGAVERTFESIGRRNLGLEILEMAERGQPVQLTHPAGPLLTLIQVMREETQKPATEKPNGRQRYDRNADLSDDDGDDSAG